MTKLSQTESAFAYRVITGYAIDGTKSAESNLSIHYKFFSYLFEQPNYECYVMELCDIYKMSPQKVSVMLRQMMKDGMLIRREENGKAYYRLTEEVIDKTNYTRACGYMAPLDITSIVSEFECEDKNFDAESIKNNKEELLKYLKKAVGLESVIWSYSRRYAKLHQLRYDTIVNGVGDQKKVQAKLDEEIKAKQIELEQLETNAPSEPVLEKTLAKTLMHEPHKPELKVTKPAEPIYEKAGLFNKKKIEKQNLQIKMQYERQLQSYEQAFAEYQLEYQAYVSEMITYKKELIEQQKKIDEFNLQKYENECKAYQEAMLVHVDAINAKKDELAKIANNPENIMTEILSCTDSWITRQKIEFEMKFVEDAIRETVSALQQLYSYGIVYGKYRNQLALAMFCDYLMSGRCDTLEGATGAYNLYELEIRSDLIISKLDKIIASLEQIKNTQYCIYSEIKKSNERLAKIENLLVANNEMQKESLAQLKAICKNTDGISKTLEEIAFNTEVTAYYSKQTKELTDALGYMVALG